MSAIDFSAEEELKTAGSDPVPQPKQENQQPSRNTYQNSKASLFSDFALRMLLMIADLALYLDAQLLRVSKWFFRRLPTAAQLALKSINAEFISGRNRIAGISHSNSQRSAHRESHTDLELQRGDVPGWVLVVLMTTGLVTALWTIAAPRLSQLLRNSLDSMNSIR